MVQVIFRKPFFVPFLFFKLLKKVGLQGVDMHFHTQYSMDGVSRVEDCLKRGDKLNIGMAITDHNEIKGAEKAWKGRGGRFIIPGVEITTMPGTHTLFYFERMGDLREFYNKEVKGLKKANPFFLPIKLEEFLEKATKYNPVICAAHPFGPGMIGIKKLKISQQMLKMIDLVEGLNGCNTRKMNEKSLHWAELMGKGVTAGSDGHTTAELGNDICFAFGENFNEFMKSIKSRKNILLGKEKNKFIDLIQEIEKEEVYLERAVEKHLGGEWLKIHWQIEWEDLRKKIKSEEHQLAKHFHIHHYGVKREHKEFIRKQRHYRHLVKHW